METLTQRARELGQSALAITDHGNMHGALAFYKAAKKNGVKPIIGMEAYVAHGAMSDRNPRERQPNHLTIIAQNSVGYQNLLTLTSLAHMQGFYQKPRVDKELLAQHSEGLIVLSGCPSGELMSAIRNDDIDEARRVAGWYSEVFTGRYYIEIMGHGIDKFAEPTNQAITLSKSLNLPLVLTNDSHYTFAEDDKAHEALLCIGTNSTMSDPKRMKFDSDKFYLRSEDEMRQIYPDLPEAVENTNIIADSVELELSFEQLTLPNPGIPDGLSSRDHLQNLAVSGLKDHYPVVTSEHEERLKYELTVIAETGFDEYMLIVKDIAEFARRAGIRMGVRGSAASSIVLYCLGVTDVDPVGWGLVFERFLNPERIGMPDVDFDFADDRRAEVIDYTVNKYGHDKVAQIGTFGTMGARGSIRDTARVLGYPPSVGDRLARMVPGVVNTTLKGALETSDLGPEYKQAKDSKEIVDLAMRLEGVSRHSSTHAAGIVISKDPLLDLVPLQRPDPDTGFSIAQWGMDDIADVGLLKIDYLGLTNLTILGKALEIIQSTSGETIDLLNIPDKDSVTAQMMSLGHTFGVFQMEGSGMTEASRLLEPSGISDMAALVALYRPGPMEHIPRFAEVKKGLKEPHYLDPALEPILAETYGVITYQEQVLQIAQKFAGYSLGQADVMRKAMGKKIAEVMVEERDRFVSGIEMQGHKRRLGEKLFDLIEPFAGYAFNKAHAVCYGLIAYQTAYLKAHYPIEYMAAVLCSSSGDRTALAAAECQRLGISISLPDINRSIVNFNVEVSESTDRAPSIRYGLGQVKDVGAGSAELIVAERLENGEYASMEDFAARLPSKSANRRIIEALARAGSFDTLCDRGVVLQNIDRIIDISKEQKRLKETGQTTMFDLLSSDGLGGLDMSDPMRLPSRQIQLWEREYLGTYISDHPLTEASLILDKYVTHSPAELTSFLHGEEAVVAGIITDVRELTARVSNRPFCAIRVEGFTGSSEIMIWNKEYEHYFKTGVLTEGNIILARVSIRTNKNSRTTVAAKFVVAYDPYLKNIGPNFNERQFQTQRLGDGRDNNLLAIKDDPRAERSRIKPLNMKSFPADLLVSPETKSNKLQSGTFEAPVTLDNGLLIRIDETRDAGADRRRIHYLFKILDESPGSYAVTLEIEDRNHLRSQVSRQGIDERMISDIATRLRKTLGVLGSVQYDEPLSSEIDSGIIGAEHLKVAGGN